MKYVSEEELRKWLITDGCEEGHGYIDEDDFVCMDWQDWDTLQEPTDKSNLEKMCEELSAENDDLRDQLAMRDRFQKQDPCDNCRYLDGDGCRLVFEQIEYGKASDKCPSNNNVSITVSRGVFEQVMWERDVAIGQLKELGYELGQKIETCEDTISRQAVLNYIYNDLGLGDEENGKDVERQMELDESYRYIKSLPSTTPQPRIGHWINLNKNNDGHCDDYGDPF